MQKMLGSVTLALFVALPALAGRPTLTPTPSAERGKPSKEQFDQNRQQRERTPTPASDRSTTVKSSKSNSSDRVAPTPKATPSP